MRGPRGGQRQGEAGIWFQAWLMGLAGWLDVQREKEETGRPKFFGPDHQQHGALFTEMRKMGGLDGCGREDW